MRLAFTILLGAAFFCQSTAGAFEHIVVFGDSLSDNGNVYFLTSGQIPAAPYYSGRFSNGPNWADDLAGHFGVLLDPAVYGGTNYAFGGAESGPGFSQAGTLNTGIQIDSYQSSVGAFSSNDLVVLLIGANDFLNGQQDVSVTLGNIRSEWQELRAMGAQHLLVGTIPNLSLVPEGRAMPGIGKRSAAFNAGVRTEAKSFRLQHPFMDLDILDLETLISDVTRNPRLFGLSDATRSYLDVQPGVDPNRWLFWDSVHPSARGHQLIARTAIAALD